MVKKIAENFNRLIGRTNVTDDRQTDGTAIAYSERERKYKNLIHHESTIA